MARTDIHRPSAPEFDPEDYDFHGCFDLRPEYGDGGARMQVVNTMIDAGYRFAGSGAGTCGHCGANARYVALLTHSNGRDMMYVGEQCLDNRFELSKDQFQSLRKTASLNRERMRKQERIAALVKAYPFLGAVMDPNDAIRCGDFVASVMWRLRENGELSERQIEAIRTSIERSAEWAYDAAVREDRQRSAPPALPCPEGNRLVVEGEIVSTKWQDNDFGGGCIKMLVVSSDGWKVWGTMPSALDAQRGDVVRFTANVTRSEDDETFGFAKRPTKAEVLTAVGV